MSSNVERVEIPFEISTIETAKLQKAKKDAKELKEQTTKAPIQIEQKEERGGIFGGREDPGVRGFQKRKRGLSPLKDKTSKAAIVRDTSFNTAVQRAIEKNKIQDTMSRDLGLGQANNILAFGKDPKSVVLGLLKGAGALALIIKAPEFAEALAAELQKKGGFLDRFFEDAIDTRFDALRDRTQQQRILAGFDQLIITQGDGTLNPRDAYNSFEIFNTNQEQIENDQRIRIQTT